MNHRDEDGLREKGPGDCTKDEGGGRRTSKPEPGSRHRLFLWLEDDRWLLFSAIVCLIMTIALFAPLLFLVTLGLFGLWFRRAALYRKRSTGRSVLLTSWMVLILTTYAFSHFELMGMLRRFASSADISMSADAEFDFRARRGRRLMEQGEFARAAEAFEAALNVPNTSDWCDETQRLYIEALVRSGDEKGIKRLAEAMMRDQADELVERFARGKITTEAWHTGIEEVDERFTQAVIQASRNRHRVEMTRRIATVSERAAPQLEGQDFSALKGTLDELKELVIECVGCEGSQEANALTRRITLRLREHYDETLSETIEELRHSIPFMDKRQLEEARVRLALALSPCQGCTARREARSMVADLSNRIDSWPVEVRTVGQLKRNHESLRGIRSRVGGRLSIAPYHACRYDDSTMWRSFRFEGSPSEWLHLYCRRGEERCEDIHDSLTSRDSIRGTATLIYPRHNPRCEESQATLLEWTPSKDVDDAP